MAFIGYFVLISFKSYKVLFYKSYTINVFLKNDKWFEKESSKLLFDVEIEMKSFNLFL